MAVDITSIIQADTPAQLQSKVAEAIADGKQPVGYPFAIGQQSGVVKLVQMVGTGTGNAITAYKVVAEQDIGKFAEDLETAVNVASSQTYGSLMLMGDTSAFRQYIQVVVTGTVAGGGGGGSVTLPATGTAQELTAGTVTDTRLWSPKVLQDAFDANPAAGTAGDLSTGTDTAVKGWSAKLIHDEIARQIAAIPPSA